MAADKAYSEALQKRGAAQAAVYAASEQLAAAEAECEQLAAQLAAKQVGACHAA